ncbi:Subtilisin-like protease SBT1.4 [Linum perenne]
MAMEAARTKTGAKHKKLTPQGHKFTTGPVDLNYPSNSVVFKQGSGDAVTYKRVVKNVGSSLDAVYEVKVNATANVDVKVFA